VSCPRRLHCIVVRERVDSQDSKPTPTKTRENSHHELKIKPNSKCSLKTQDCSCDCALNLASRNRLQRAVAQYRARGFAGANPVQNISAQASKDLNLLESLYNEYKSNPSTSALQKIQTVIADINQSLPALLQAAHIGDPVLSARLAAGVNLILTAVASFAALIPQTSTHLAAQKMSHPTSAIPKASDLKKQWNQQVCGPTSNSELDFSATGCTVK
jgi:hypothetical protein